MLPGFKSSRLIRFSGRKESGRRKNEPPSSLSGCLPLELHRWPMSRTARAATTDKLLVRSLPICRHFAARNKLPTRRGLVGIVRFAFHVRASPRHLSDTRWNNWVARESNSDIRGGRAMSYAENQAGRLGRAASQQSAGNLRAFARSINGGNSSRPAATKIQFEC